MLGFKGSALPIRTEAPYAALAADFGCELAVIRAVADVESRGAAFLPDGRPVILFERHVFRRLTGGAHDAAADISAARPGGYGAPGAAQYDRLSRAAALNRDAALKSASWGRFQIMGFNAEMVGFDGVESFVSAMMDSEKAHLDAFAAYVRAAGLVGFLQSRDWAGFARGYNGPGYKRNRYAEKLDAAWRRFGGAPGGFRVRSIADLQRALDYLGARPGLADGLMGPRTRAAIERFETQCRLPVSGAASPSLKQAVQAVYFALAGPDARPAL